MGFLRGINAGSKASDWNAQGISLNRAMPDFDVSIFFRDHLLSSA
jgi:hypothetical protein